MFTNITTVRSVVAVGYIKKAGNTPDIWTTVMTSNNLI